LTACPGRERPARLQAKTLTRQRSPRSRLGTPFLARGTTSRSWKALDGIRSLLQAQEGRLDGLQKRHRDHGKHGPMILRRLTELERLVRGDPGLAQVAEVETRRRPLRVGVLRGHEHSEEGFLIDHRDGVDLDQATRIGGEPHHLHCRRCRLGVAEELGPNAVERILIRQIGDEAVAGYHVSEVRPNRLEPAL